MTARFIAIWVTVGITCYALALILLYLLREETDDLVVAPNSVAAVGVRMEEC